MNNNIDFDRLPYWQQQLLSAIKSLEKAITVAPFEKRRFSKQTVWSLRPALPYVVHQTGIKGKYILLNRDYRPIGIHHDGMVEYQNFPFMHIDQSDIYLFAKSYEHNQGDQINGRFFNDSCAPWSSKANAEALLKRYKLLLITLHGGIV